MGKNVGLGNADAPNRGFELYLTSLLMVLVAGLFVLGRLAARWTKRQFGMDDYTIVLSLVRLQDAGPGLICEPPVNDFSQAFSVLLSISINLGKAILSAAKNENCLT